MPEVSVGLQVRSRVIDPHSGGGTEEGTGDSVLVVPRMSCPRRLGSGATSVTYVPAARQRSDLKAEY